MFLLILAKCVRCQTLVQLGLNLLLLSAWFSFFIALNITPSFHVFRLKYLGLSLIDYLFIRKTSHPNFRTSLETEITFTWRSNTPTPLSLQSWKATDAVELFLRIWKISFTFVWLINYARDNVERLCFANFSAFACCLMYVARFRRILRPTWVHHYFPSYSCIRPKANKPAAYKPQDPGVCDKLRVTLNSHIDEAFRSETDIEHTSLARVRPRKSSFVFDACKPKS